MRPSRRDDAERRPGGSRRTIGRRPRSRGLFRRGARSDDHRPPGRARAARTNASRRKRSCRAGTRARAIPRAASRRRPCGRKPMTTDVVIGNFAGAHLLSTCISSLRAQTAPPQTIFVVDGGSHDDSVSVAQELGAAVIETQNLGLGFLYNTGARASNADYVFLANNDIALEEDCLRALVEVLDENPSCFAADAKQFDWEGRAVIHGHTSLRPGRLVGEYLPGMHLDHCGGRADVTPTVCANGAAMLVRRNMMLELGGFDETFFMEWEDLDLCWRAWLRDRPTVYVPNALVRHRVGAATPPTVALRRATSSHHNLVRFALKCLPWPAAGRLVAGEVLRAPRYPSAIPRALASVARELPEIMRARRAAGAPEGTFSRLVSSQPSRHLS